MLIKTNNVFGISPPIFFEVVLFQDPTRNFQWFVFRLLHIQAEEVPATVSPGEIGACPVSVRLCQVDVPVNDGFLIVNRTGNVIAIRSYDAAAAAQGPGDAEVAVAI